MICLVSSDGEKEDTSSEATVELLSPSEVVKMRKKTRLSQEESKENATSKTKEETPNKRMKVQRSEKKGKEKEENKEKETREKKKEKTPKVEGKRFKDGKDKVKKQGTRRKVLQLNHLLSFNTRIVKMISGEIKIISKRVCKG